MQGEGWRKREVERDGEGRRGREREGVEEEELR